MQYVRHAIGYSNYKGREWTHIPAWPSKGVRLTSHLIYVTLSGTLSPSLSYELVPCRACKVNSTAPEALGVWPDGARGV